MWFEKTLTLSLSLFHSLSLSLLHAHPSLSFWPRLTSIGFNALSWTTLLVLKGYKLGSVGDHAIKLSKVTPKLVETMLTDLIFGGLDRANYYRPNLLGGHTYNSHRIQLEVLACNWLMVFKGQWMPFEAEASWQKFHKSDKSRGFIPCVFQDLNRAALAVAVVGEPRIF